jgi:hypothetical protein
MYKLVIVGLLALSSLNVFSQENEFGKNIMIESKYKTVLPKLKKLDYKPSIKDTVLVQPSFDYFLKAKRVKSFYNLIENDYPKYKEKNLEEITGSYLRLGAGNYMSFLGEFAYNNPTDEEYNWGMHINSFSTAGTVDKREIGFIEQTALVYLMKLEEEKSYGVSISYDRNLLHLYNLADLSNNPKDRRSEFVGNIFYNNELGNGFSYATNLEYTNFVDTKTDVIENLIDIDVNVKIDLGENELLFNIGLDYLKSGTDSDYSSDFDFTSFTLEPHYKTSLWKFKFDIGFGMSQYLGDNSKFYLYPKTNIYVDLFGKSLGLYAKVDGGVSDNNYLKSYKKNPYAIVGESMQTFDKLTFGGGLKGRIDDLFWYNIGAEYSDVDNYMYYGLDINNTCLVQKYADIKLFSFNAEVGVNIDEDLMILSTLKTYSFNVQKFYNKDKEILNVPSFEAFIHVKYKLSNELSINSDWYLLGDRETSSLESKVLIFDMNASAEYRFSKYIQVFASVNNIFDQNYQRWEQYPVMGISVLAGCTISL